MGLGLLSVWHLLRRRLGLVDVSGHARACVAVPVCLAARKILPCARLDSVWPVGRLFRIDRARGSIRCSSARYLDPLPALSSASSLEKAVICSSDLGHRDPLALDHAELRTVPPLHSGAQRIRTGALYWEQRVFRALGE